MRAKDLPPPAQRETLGRLTPDRLRQISKTFSKSTSYGSDGIHMSHYTWMDNEGLEVLATIYAAMELGRRPPQQWMTMKTPLLPKKVPGDFRSIAVISSPMRLWGKGRREICDQWEAEHDRDYFAAGVGRRPLEPVWRAALRGDACATPY